MAVTLITKAAYARHRGCDEKAVRKAIADRVLAAWNDPRQRNIAGSCLPLLALALYPGAGGVPDDWHEPLESWHAGQRSRFLARLLLRRDFHRES